MKGHNYGFCYKCGRTHIHPRGTLGKRFKLGPMSEIHRQRLSESHQTFRVSREELYDLYWNQKLSDAKIAIIFGVTAKAILKRRRVLGIPARSLSESITGELNGFFGRHHDIPMSERHKWSRPGEANPFFGKHHTEEAKMAMSKKKKELCKNTDFLRKVMIARDMKPNKSEMKLTDILNRHFEGEWKYVGDGRDGTVIGGKIPDWININGKKLIIELFGNLWHSIPGQSYSRTAEGTVKHYATYGLKCLIVDYREVRDEQKIVAKIKEFMEDRL